jgi:hypothetical protein
VFGIRTLRRHAPLLAVPRFQHVEESGPLIFREVPERIGEELESVIGIGFFA